MSAWQERAIKWTCVGLEVCCLLYLCPGKSSQPPFSHTDMQLENEKDLVKHLFGRRVRNGKECAWMTGPPWACQSNKSNSGAGFSMRSKVFVLLPQCASASPASTLHLPLLSYASL